MKQLSFLFLVLSCSLLVAQQKLSKTKTLVTASIDSHRSDLIKMSDDIWANAETAFEEYESSKILSDYAEANGFKVEKGVAGIAYCLCGYLWIRKTGHRDPWRI